MLTGLAITQTPTMTQPNSQDSDQARYWNEGGGRRWSENIDRIERMLQPLGTRLVEFAQPRQGEKVLDVGCGGGLTSKAFTDAVGPTGEVLGLDVSTQILAIARERFSAVSNLRFVQGDAGSMSFGASTYSLITSRFGVMFFPDPVGAFTHLRSALRSDGRLAFVCWRGLALNPWMAVPVKAMFEILPRPEPTPPGAPGPFAFADSAYLSRVLHAAGFKHIDIVPHDEIVNLGALDDAVKQMTRMGPGAPVFAEANDDARARALDALPKVFEPYIVDNHVQMMSATWLVRATS